MWLWIKDMWSAIWAWMSIWFVDTYTLTRRRNFVNDIRKDYKNPSLPLRIWKKAYSLRLDRHYEQ